MHAAGTPLITPGVALALLAGIGACLALPVAPSLVVAAGGVIAGLLLGVRGHRAVAAVLLGFGLAGLHAQHALQVQLPAAPAKFDTVLTGRIVELPRFEPRRTVFALDVEHDARGRLGGRTVRLSWYADRDATPPVLHAGERWRLGVRLRAPRGLRNPGGSDTEKHAFADRLAATGHVRAGERSAAASGLQAWRDRESARIASALRRPGDRFIRALALGDTRFLGDADWAVLRANGLTHLIAISGFHVGMVAGVLALGVRGLWWLLPLLGRWLPARIAASIAGLAGAGVYAAASGFALPTVRTLLMIAVVALAHAARRGISMPQALAIAAVAILVVDPLAVLSAGFWLSFAGVAWLLWCMPRAGTSAVRELVRAQAVATVGLLPLTVVLFGQASLAGPVANLVAVPWWSLVVAPLSVAGIALDALHPAAGAAAWGIASWCFDVGWPLFERLAALPFAAWYLPEASPAALPLAVLGAAWGLMPRGTPGRALALLLWLPLLWPDRQAPATGDVELTAIDVGQGLSVLVRTRHHALLYDAGPALPDGFDAGDRAVVPALRARGLAHLRRTVISHADLDHAGGWASVRREMPADDVEAPPGSGVEGARPCLAGERWTWDGVRFEVLHPPRDFPYLANDSSCVLRIAGHNGRALLTGDISAVVERRLVAAESARLRAEVVLVAHHGSRHSSDPAFVRATGAREAIFSTGHANRFRHPNRQVVERWADAGARTWNTADSGAVTVRIDAGGTHVTTERDRRRRMWDAARRPGGSAGLSYRRF